MDTATDIFITPMSAEDIEEIAELEKLCFTTPWSRAALAVELDRDDAVFLTAHRNGVLYGYIGMNTVLDEGYIANLAVHPECRRQGTARQLLLALIACVQQKELAFVTLEVRPSNLAAIGLYSNLGFTEQGRRTGFYSHPVEDGLIMTKFFCGGNAL